MSRKYERDAIDVDGGLINGGNPGGQALAKVVLENQRYCLATRTAGHTNNEAELFAILFGLVFAVKNGKTLIYSDSKWAIGVTTMNWKVKIPRLRLLSTIICSLLKYHNVRVEWKPRHINKAT